jgi:hypothetical protein
MTGPMPGSSGPASEEYFRQLAEFNANRDRFMMQLQGALSPQQQQPLVPTAPIQQSQQNPPSTQWSDPDLMGAARFWGIPEDVAAHMPHQVLLSQIEMLRQGARPDEDTFANRVGAMAAVPGMFLTGGAEALSSLAQSIPLIGPALKRTEGMQHIDSYIRSVEEGFRTITPENFQPVLTGANVVGNIAATWYPAAGAWGLAGKPLRAVSNPILRGALQGGASAYLLEGGGDHPGAAVALGAPLGAAGAALAPALEGFANKISKQFLSPAMFDESAMLRPVNRLDQASDMTKIASAAMRGDESAQAIMQDLQHSGRMPGGSETRSYGLNVETSDALATQMNKVNTIVSSPELPRVAQQALADDASVAEAAMANNPAGTNVVEGVSDPAKFVTGVPVAPHVAFAQRQGRLSALLSDQPITDKMIGEYEQHGVYSGQTVLNERGIPHQIDAISNDGVAVLTNPNTGSQIRRSVGKLSPLTENPGSMNVPGLWDSFQQFADQQTIATQMAMGGGLNPTQFETVRTASMPQYISDFLDTAGIHSPADRARITQSFNRDWIRSFANYAPPEAAFNTSMQEHLGAVVNQHPPTPIASLDAAADTKGYIALPGENGSWTVRNIAPGLDGKVGPMDIRFDSIDAAETWLQKVNREMPDISPAMPVPGEVAGGLFREPQQLPNSNTAAPEAIVKSIQEMTEANGGVPVVPPEEVAAARGDWGKLKNLWNRASAFTPMRARFASISQGVRNVAGEDFGLASDYDQLTNSLVMHHNAMHEPVNTLADILAPIDTKRLINGEWMRTWQIGDDAQRLAVAQRLGWSTKEISAMGHFSQLISNVAQEDVNPELRQYIGQLAERQSVPALFNSTWDTPAAADAINAWRDHASSTNINLRELDPRVFGESFIRSVFWKRDMAPMFDPIMEKWNGYKDEQGISQLSGFMRNWMNVMKQGYTADDDLALDMIHSTAQKLLGDSFTRQQAKELVNFGMNTTHAAFLGYRVHVMARDALQLFFALPRAGADLASVIGKYTTDPAYRSLVWNSALNEGAIQLTMPHRVSPGALGGELEQASVGMAPENMSRRMRVLGAVGSELRDWVPDVLKGSSESIMKPLYLYGKQQELMRALVYRAGFEKAERALSSFRGAGAQADLGKLMQESTAASFDPAWQQEFQRLVASGDDQKAAGFLGRQLADATQFKYGASENPSASKTITGKLFMQFGSFQTQYLQYLRESVVNDLPKNWLNPIDVLKSNPAKTIITFGTVSAALEAAQHESGWNFRLMNPYMIGFAGGPAISTGIGLLQGASSVTSALMDPDKAGLAKGLAAGGQALGALGSMVNPVSGLYNTASGLGSALNDSPSPGKAIGRLMLTGERGALPDILQSVHSVDLVPASNAVRQNDWQLPQVPQMQPIYPSGVPVPNGTGSGNPLPLNDYSPRPNESWEQFQARMVHAQSVKHGGGGAQF